MLCCPILYILRTIPTSVNIVVSPLIALEQDQVANIKKKGLNSVCASTSDDEGKHKVVAGYFQLIYVHKSINML